MRFRPVVAAIALSLASCGDDGDSAAAGSEDGSSSSSTTSVSTTTEDSTADPTTGSQATCPDDWFDRTWARRTQVTVNNDGGGQFDDFPLLLTFAGVDLSESRLDGFDLRFRDPAGSRLSHDLDSFDMAIDGVAWVNVDLRPEDATQSFFVYFGNPLAGNAESPNEVWADASGVWHMGQVIEGVLAADDGVSGIDGTSEGTTSVQGRISIGREFSASEGSRIDFGPASESLASGWTDLSLSMWLLADYDSDDAWTTAATFAARGDALVGGQLRRDPGQGPDLGLFEFELGYGDGFSQSASIEIPRQQWVWIAVDFDGSTLRTYVDGTLASQVATVADTLGSGAGPLVFGAQMGGFDGIVDEVRIYQATYPLAWYEAQYRSMTDAMVTYGPVETCEG